ncbi:sigma-70 family RNA polymerase sigma factor [Phenylobacterium sp.]|uniref:sigma-70 family RNA polymerase sigma factor n=1 Tax=Phenylobacterium sp. TaxID=1871053 RepID=UPI00273051C0|nr:sigma-70 family RNA polymerase sigma factor [Phenylobacterium sp.]MDP1873228.1 sigma-70 family RNA polymerase sigma factor [Phenylobacterium sp.]MDP3490573.1 sigma-70 family RNA polymerase sigma factor [Phenylobacterium sp.]
MEDIDLQIQSLIALSLAGDGAAYARLLALLAPRLRAYFSRRLPDPADAEDLVQETLIAIHTKRATYDSRLAFAPWVYGIARYKLIDHFRRRGVRRHVPLEAAGVLLAVSDTEAGATRADLHRLLAKLPARQRGLLEDVRLRGLTIAEAAARYGYTEGAAKVALHRTMKSLSASVAIDED